jgi:D-sedoheptulose 7-phosphate isomerase
VSDEFSRIFSDVATHMAAIANSSYVADVGQAADLLYAAFLSGHTLYAFGNGGSAADAQHVTAELVGRFSADRRPLPAVALSANAALLTAWSNDHSFDDVFARQIEALGKPGDVALGISTSGASANVVRALQAARARGLTTIALTGAGGRHLAGSVDLLLAVPLESTPRVQEVHVVTYHAICAALEARLLQANRPGDPIIHSV